MGYTRVCYDSAGKKDVYASGGKNKTKQGFKLNTLRKGVIFKNDLKALQKKQAT